MKSKVKRGSLRTISFVLSVVILITSIGLASLITANAYSKLTFYYKLGSGSWTSSEVTLTSNSGTVDVTVSAGTTMYSVIKTDNNEWYGNQTLTVGGTNYLSSLSSNYNYTSGGNNNTFTPSSTGTYTFTINMSGSKTISVSGGSEPEPTGSGYYMEGRFRIYNSSMTAVYTYGNGNDDNWDVNSTNIQFETTDDEDVFVLHTRSTIAQLSEKIGRGTYKGEQYFNIKKNSDGTLFYSNGSDTKFNENNSGVANAITLQSQTEQRPYFNDSESTSTQWVDIYFNPNSLTLWFELVDPTINYYIEGRFRPRYSSGEEYGYTAWTKNGIDIPFSKTNTNGLFVLHTYSTISELSQWIDNSANKKQYFRVAKGIASATPTTWYGPAAQSGFEWDAEDAGVSNAQTLSVFDNADTGDSALFNDTSSDAAKSKYVDLYFDITDDDSPLLYFELVDAPLTYYIEGRFQVRDADGNVTQIGKDSAWATTSKDIAFSPTTTPNLYVLKTNSTITELDANVGTGDSPSYFYIGRGISNRDPNQYYYTTETQKNYDIYPTDSGTDHLIPAGTTSNNKNFHFFKDSNWTETGQYVTLYLDASGVTPKLYFEFEKPSYHYYIEGRFAVYDSTRTTKTDFSDQTDHWTHSSTKIKFTSTATSGLFKLETNMTVAELTAGGGSGNEYYFVLGRGIRNTAPTKFFRPYSDKNLKDSDANKKFEGEWTGAWGDNTEQDNFAGKHYRFNDLSSAKLVTFYYNENTEQLYFMLTPAEYSTEFYVINNAGWTTPKAYLYNSSGDGSFGAWSGQSLLGASSYNEYEISNNGKKSTVKLNPGENDTNIIFSDNGSDQTPNDVAVENGKTYIINSDKSITKVDGEAVNFIAKDSMIRDTDHKAFGEYATTAVTQVDNQVEPDSPTTAYSSTKYVTGWAVKGKDITVTTTINDIYKGKYYVAGFSFNGVTPQILAENTDDSGVYSCTYTIPEDFAYDTLEITPIFFLKSTYSARYVSFNISGYENVKDEGWGSTLFIYPFYGNSSQAFNYGSYPGQPVINYGGRLYTQIPTYDDGETTGNLIKGVTISNGYWDLKHRDVEGWAAVDSNHHQTYDFDDFYKIYKENGSNLNSVFFTFKYEEAQAHRQNIPTSKDLEYTDYRADSTPATLTQAELDAYGAANGFESYKNANGKLIDLFGNVLTGSALSAEPVYVISQGYEYNNAGCFGTEWAVFYKNGDNYTKVTESKTNYSSIVPSALHIKDIENFAKNYPLVDEDLLVSDFVNIYTALEDYADRPVQICYEKDIKAGYYHRKNGKSGDDEAYRCDGVWSYTLKTDFVSANTLIEYTDDNGASWYEDTFNSSTAVGTNTKCKAYFTYLSADKNGYASSYDGTTAISNVLVDDSKYFTFKAESAGQYEFVGWSLRDSAGNESSITSNADNASETKMSSTVTLVARFKKVSSGSLLVSHTIDSSSEGLGDVYLGIRILESDGTTQKAVIADAATNTSAKTIGKQYITSDSTDKIEVTLRTVRRGENTFNKFQLSKDGAENIDADSTYLPSGVTPAATTTKTITFPIRSLFTGTDQNLTSLAYYSLLNETLNKYDVTFTYQDRKNASKSMRVKGTFTKGQLKNYVTGTGTSKTVAANFFSEIKPDVSNFKTDITFDFKTVTPTWAGPTDNAYTMTATVNSTLSNTLDRTVTFVTPFNMTNFVAVDDNGVYNYLAEPVETQPLTVEYGKLIKIKDGAVDLVNGNFVTAPNTLVKKEEGNDVVYYFKCWTIKTLSGETVASCYFPEFNYLTYDNCVIEAEYSTESTKYYEYFNTAQSVTATFLKNTRTQNNVQTTTDLVYSDFALSFKYKDVKFYENNGWSTNYEAGIIMQRLDAVDLDSDGLHEKTLAQYASKYASTLVTDQTNIENLIKNDTAVSDKPTRKNSFTYNKFDNKNRLEYYVGQYNSKSWNNETQQWDYSQWDKENGVWTDTKDITLNTNSKYVYRLFTYVCDKTDNDNKIVVLSAPAYFYLYNTVNK